MVGIWGCSMMSISQLTAFSFSAATLGIINMKPNPGLLRTTVIELPFSTQSCTAGSDAVMSPLGSGLSTARSSRTGFLHVHRCGVLCTPSPLITTEPAVFLLVHFSSYVSWDWKNSWKWGVKPGISFHLQLRSSYWCCVFSPVKDLKIQTWCFSFNMSSRTSHKCFFNNEIVLTGLLKLPSLKF